MPPMGSLSRILGRAAAGAGMGIAARGAYNALEGKEGGYGKAAMVGALGWTALGLRKPAVWQNAWNGGKNMVNATKSAYKTGLGSPIGQTVTGGMRRGVGGFMRNASRTAGDYAGRGALYTQGMGEWGAKAVKALGGTGGIARFARQATPGAIYGAGIGAAYGGFSDRDSMISGAMKGALAGAAGLYAWKQFGGKGTFSKLAKNFSRIPHA